MGEDFARLAYEASLRRLDKQEASRTEIRSPTGLLFAASSQRFLWGFRLAAWALAAEVVLLLASLSGTLG
jgi:hypothetical protein